VRKGKDLEGKRIALGVTGGIAAYKSAALCRELVGAGACVDALLTPSATRFITPLPFERITGRPVRVSRRDADAQPIDELAEALDLLIIAPLTAHTLARLAHGLGGDVLVDLALATRAPRLLAPAMEPEMWRHPATRRNAQCLAGTPGVRRGGPRPHGRATRDSRAGPALPGAGGLRAPGTHGRSDRGKAHRAGGGE
jgi:phosphopantothenoylcysteine decarboxylase/phosphopantothenate--cysteine ligase